MLERIFLKPPWSSLVWFDDWWALIKGLRWFASVGWQGTWHFFFLLFRSHTSLLTDDGRIKDMEKVGTQANLNGPESCTRWTAYRNWIVLFFSFEYLISIIPFLRLDRPGWRHRDMGPRAPPGLCLHPYHDDLARPLQWERGNVARRSASVPVSYQTMKISHLLTKVRIFKKIYTSQACTIF